VDPAVEGLLRATRESLERAIAQCAPDRRLGDVGHAVESHVVPLGYHVVEEYGGHGIGRNLHEDPRVENYGKAGTGRRLVPGMVLAVEPMVALGTGKTRVLDDEWTVVTADGSAAAHFEHTIAVTESGPEVLTRWDEEK
jgi:methionyl aminopeptidase